jgi:hypothetical protein
VGFIPGVFNFEATYAYRLPSFSSPGVFFSEAIRAGVPPKVPLAKTGSYAENARPNSLSLSVAW